MRESREVKDMNRLFSFFRAAWRIMYNMAVGPVMPPLPPEPIPEPDWHDDERDDWHCQSCERCTSYDPCCNCDEAECGLCEPCIPGPAPEEEPEEEPDPVPVRDRCVDMSNWWLGGPVTDEMARICMMNIQKQGYTGVIAGSQVPSIGNQQAKAALSVGMWADGYHYVKFDQDYLQNAAQADYTFEDVKDKLGILWLDLEEVPPEEWSTGVLLNFVSLMVEELEERGYLVGIYTRKQWWKDYMKSTAFFTHLPLWCTEYNLDPPYDASWWERNSFGGWDAPIWVQYKDDVDVAGVNVDLNERFVA